MHKISANVSSKQFVHIQFVSITLNKRSYPLYDLVAGNVIESNIMPHCRAAKNQ